MMLNKSIIQCYWVGVAISPQFTSCGFFMSGAMFLLAFWVATFKWLHHHQSKDSVVLKEKINPSVLSWCIVLGCTSILLTIICYLIFKLAVLSRTKCRYLGNLVPTIWTSQKGSQTGPYRSFWLQATVWHIILGLSAYPS